MPGPIRRREGGSGCPSMSVGSDSRAASTIPTIAHAMPTNCSGAGRSPCAKPTSTGTITDSDTIGATMLIGPIARPWYSAASPIVPHRPPSTP